MLFKSSTNRAIPCKILVNTQPSELQENFNDEVSARENLKPTFVEGYIPAHMIEAFYASNDYPYQTIVHAGGTCVYVDAEISEFRKLYEKHSR